MTKLSKSIGKGWFILDVISLAICGAFALWSAGYTWGESHFDPEVLVNEFKKRFLP